MHKNIALIAIFLRKKSLIDHITSNLGQPFGVFQKETSFSG
jgi:hypothetical protein